MSSFAVTRKVNPVGASPILTVEQLWAGLKRKEKEPGLFVPVIKTCTVISEEPNKVVREITTTFAPEKSIREVVESYDPTIVYFESVSETAPRITNIVSYDESDELVLTFSFARGVPGVPDVNAVSVKEVNAKVGAAVVSTIDAIRKMVVSGEIA